MADKSAEVQVGVDPNQQQGYQQPPAYSQVPTAPQGYGNYPQSQQMGGAYIQYPQGHQPGQQYVTVVAVPTQPMSVQDPQGPSNDYLVLSILSTILCFWPIGIAAIVFSVKTRSANQIGDYRKAKTNASNAKIFNIISLTVGIFLWVIVVLAQLGWIIPLAIFLSLTRR